MTRYIVEITESKNILDVGCGPGADYQVLKDCKIQYTGIDITPQVIEYCKQTFPEGDFRVGDIFKLPFPDKSFDIVLCRDVLEHFPPPWESGYNWRAALKELSRVANKFLVLNFYLGFHRENKPRVRKREDGFYEVKLSKNQFTAIYDSLGWKQWASLEYTLRLPRETLLWLIREELYDDFKRSQTGY